MSLINKTHIRQRALLLAPKSVERVSADVYAACERAVQQVLLQAAAQHRRGSKTLAAPISRGGTPC